MSTSSTSVPDTPARSIAARIATAPRSDALSVPSPPRNLPIGVRAAPTMKTSGVVMGRFPSGAWMVVPAGRKAQRSYTMIQRCATRVVSA
jgi:hypothetical protein